jgi:uncharacterized protein YxjI
MRIQCSCGKALNVADKLVGKRIRCPACSAVLTVPENSDPSAPGKETAVAPPPTKRPPTDEEAGDETPVASGPKHSVAKHEDGDEILVAPKKKQPAAREEADDEAPAPPGKKRRVADEEGEDEAPAPKKRRAAAGPSILDKNQFVVKEQTKLFSSRKAYDLVDADSSEVVATATQKVGAMAALLGMVLGKDGVSLTIEVRQKPDDDLLFSVCRSGIFFKKVQLLDERGKAIGSYKAKKFSLSGGFHIYDKAGKHFAEIQGKMFKSDYKFVAPDGATAMGSVSKTWGGMAKALLTGAQTYVVNIDPEYAGDTAAKMLMLGAAIAIDAMFTKAGSKAAAGGAAGGLLGGGGDDE